MKKITITIPDEMEHYFWEHDPTTVFERNALILYPYIKTGRLSINKAAEILDTNFNTLANYYGSQKLYLVDSLK